MRVHSIKGVKDELVYLLALIWLVTKPMLLVTPREAECCRETNIN